MSVKTKITIFSLSLLSLALIAASFWHIITHHDIQVTLARFRRRLMDNTTISTSTIPPEQLKVMQDLEASKNKSRLREMENSLEIALAKLLITSPEDIMITFMTRENFGCKDLKRALQTFSSRYDGDLKSELVYVRLFRSIAKFYQLLCNDNHNEKLRKIFNPWQDELLKLHEEFVDCQGTLDWYERNSTFACAEANKIIECYHAAMSFDISRKVARNYLEVFEKVMNEAMSQSCKFERITSAEGGGFNFERIFIILVLLIVIITVITVVCLSRKKSSKY